MLPAALADLRPQLAEFAELSLRYHAYWPRARHRTSPYPEPPAATLARSLAHLSAWAEDAEPVIQQLQRCEAERAELLLWRRVLAAVGDERRSTSRASPAPGPSCTRGCSCSRPTASPSCRRAR